MEIGDTFLLQHGQIDDHLWVVISEPQQDQENVVIVSLTTLVDWKDNSCVLGVGDHPWIRHDTCVSYRDAKRVSEKTLDSLVAKSELLPREPASDEMLRKIIDGANLTDEMPIKCREVLLAQNLIDG